MKKTDYQMAMMAPARDSYMAEENQIAEPDLEVDRSASGMIVDPLPPSGDEGFTEGVERTIVKNANLGLVVEDTRQTVDQVTQAVNAINGFVTSSNIYEHEYAEGAVSADMTVRVPVDQLENTMAEIKQLATKVVNESLTADDRTEQKIDLEAQLRNLRATEAQMLTIMERATEIEDVLNVQRELNSIRGQIERLEARLENLEGAAAMSTLRINITTEESELPVVNPKQPSLWQEVRIAFRDAVQFYRNLFVGGLRLAIIGLPIGLVGWLGWRVLKPKSTSKK